MESKHKALQWLHDLLGDGRDLAQDITISLLGELGGLVCWEWSIQRCINDSACLLNRQKEMICICLPAFKSEVILVYSLCVWHRTEICSARSIALCCCPLNHPKCLSLPALNEQGLLFWLHSQLQGAVLLPLAVAHGRFLSLLRKGSYGFPNSIQNTTANDFQDLPS